MSATIYLDGGRGFVGSAVLDALLAQGFAVRSLVRTPGEPRDGVTEIVGDLSDAAALDRALQGCSAAIHLVGIIFEKGRSTFYRVHVEGTANLVNAMERVGVPRLVHMSALGARPDAPSEYHRSKFAGELHAQMTNAQVTILRPSLIHGPRGEFTRQAAAWARGKALPWLFMPYFGTGFLGTGPKRRVQPIYVDDVASAFMWCLHDPTTAGRSIDLVGPEPKTWPAMYRTIAEALTGHAKRTLPIPAWYAKALTFVTPPPLLPFNRSQVQMAVEDSVADATDTTKLLGRAPVTLAAAIARYREEL